MLLRFSPGCPSVHAPEAGQISTSWWDGAVQRDLYLNLLNDLPETENSKTSSSKTKE